MATGQPVWALAERFPAQGDWTEADYLALPEGYPRMELSNGRLEVLSMPTDRHQAVLTAMLLALVALTRRIAGWARPAGLRVKLGPGRFREPDVAFLSRDRHHLKGEAHWMGADLVVEVVSGSADDRARDYVTKRKEYAAAGIPEYWIVDPDAESITVLTLHGDQYAEHGVFGRGTDATSPHHANLVVPVTGILDAE